MRFELLLGCGCVCPTRRTTDFSDGRTAFQVSCYRVAELLGRPHPLHGCSSAPRLHSPTQHSPACVHISSSHQTPRPRGARTTDWETATDNRRQSQCLRVLQAASRSACPVDKQATRHTYRAVRDSGEQQEKRVPKIVAISDHWRTIKYARVLISSSSSRVLCCFFFFFGQPSIHRITI